MSYYYEDNSYYCYSEPTHYYDVSPEPIYHDDFPPEPIYHDDFPPELIYHDDIPPEPVYGDDDFVYQDSNTQSGLAHFNDVTIWLPPPPPTSHEVVDELELDAYADAAANRSYSEDEIHPAYRDNPIIETVYDDDTQTPIPSFFDTTSYNDYSDEKLELCIQGFRDTLEEMEEWDIEDAKDDAAGIIPLPADWKPYRESLRFAQGTRWLHRAETIQGQRMERDAEDTDDEILENLVSSPAQTQSIPLPLPHHDFNNNIVITHFTPTFLTATTKRREPRYYFAPLPRRRRHPPELRNTTRTRPPDIRPPKPHPMSPNIHTRLRLRSLGNRHPPDTLPPTPIPPKPNIPSRPTVQQPRRPPHIRPRRKHPPHPMNQTHPLIPRHHRNVIRRILKKEHPPSF
jgi:hypothetical protein